LAKSPELSRLQDLAFEVAELIGRPFDMVLWELLELAGEDHALHRELCSQRAALPYPPWLVPGTNWPPLPVQDPAAQPHTNG
jgi:hypothetical protein